MYGRCKDCVKNLQCFKPTGMRFGFCETDFEPKEKETPRLKTEGMQWKKLSSSEWEAVGKFGKFVIKRVNGRFLSQYASEYTAFNLRVKDALSEAKEMCENNEYWEVAA